MLAEDEASGLLPGAWRWEPEIAENGPLSMIVDLTTQRAFVYQGSMLVGMSTIASGKPGHETPTGTFTVLEKERFHRSNKYDDAPMPYMERLDWSGLALHGGHPRGYPASHGCIRLPMGFAAALFKEDTRGMRVVITGHAPGRREIAIAERRTARANPQWQEAATGYQQSAGYGNAVPAAPQEPPAPYATAPAPYPQVTAYGNGAPVVAPQPPCCAPVPGTIPAGPPAPPACATDREADANAGVAYSAPQGGCNNDNNNNDDDRTTNDYYEAPPAYVPPPPG